MAGGMNRGDRFGGVLRAWRRGSALAGLALGIASSGGCPPATGGAAGETPPPASDLARDTTSGRLIPAGFGSLRQEDLSITVQAGRLLVRALPLDESIIRVLAPDTYRSLHEVHESRRAEIAGVASRYGVRGFSAWHVQFFALEPDVRFTPMDIVISSVGRDFRPLQILALTPGFGQNRLGQREVQTAVYLFDEGVDVNQPLALTVEAVRNSTWQETLRLIERERAAVRIRAGRSAPPPG